MIEIQKAYSKSLDEEYGKHAESVVIRYLNDWPGIVQVKQYPFGEKDVDLQVVQESGSIYFADIERRENWKWPMLTFPHKEIHIPFRKYRMILTRQPFIYFIVRSDCQRMASLPGSAIVNSHVRSRKNKYDNARFFDVPVESLFYWELKEEKDGEETS